MSLNKILSGFSKTLRDLEKLVQQNTQSIGNKLERILELEEESEALLHEKHKALVIIENLNKLLGDK